MAKVVRNGISLSYIVGSSDSKWSSMVPAIWYHYVLGGLLRDDVDVHLPEFELQAKQTAVSPYASTIHMRLTVPDNHVSHAD
jgi:hypothetical protein